jgi:hypothetical protein
LLLYGIHIKFADTHEGSLFRSILFSAMHAGDFCIKINVKLVVKKKKSSLFFLKFQLLCQITLCKKKVSNWQLPLNHWYLTMPLNHSKKIIFYPNIPANPEKGTCFNFIYFSSAHLNSSNMVFNFLIIHKSRVIMKMLVRCCCS